MQNPTRSQQLLLFTALYAAQGLPYGFFTLALPTFMRESGMQLTVISLASLLYWPWALKFLWAPYLDYLDAPRRWLLGLQFASIASALLLAYLVGESYWLLGVGALLFTTLAASQDVLTDGLAVRMLSTRNLGLGNGVQVGAYRLGMILGGGAMLPLFVRANGTIMFLCMAALLALTTLPVLRIQNLTTIRSSVRPDMRQRALQWRRRLETPGMWTLLLLIFCYRIGDAMISQHLNPFMSDQKFSSSDISLAKGVLGNTASLLGALLGGWFAFRVTRRSLLLVAGLAQAASFTPYLYVALGSGGRELLWVATAAEGLIGTIATVALFTLMMDGSDPEHAGSDYSIYASAVVIITTVGGLLGGLLGDAFGFAALFGIGIGLCVLGSLILVWQLDRRASTPRIAAAWSRAPATAV